MRDWRFSSVVSSGRPANWGASMSAKVFMAGSMAISS